MKVASILLLSATVFSCGKPSASEQPFAAQPNNVTKTTAPSTAQPAAQPEPQSGFTYYFNTASDLPTCDDRYMGALAYIESEKKFKACRSGSWGDVAVDLGKKEQLVSVEAEASGSNCKSGGKVIKVGIDDNGNSILDGNEVDRNDYICQTDPLAIKASYAITPDGTELCTSYADDSCYLAAAQVDVFNNGMWQLRFFFSHVYAVTGDSDVSSKDIAFIFPDGEKSGVVKLLDQFVFRTGSSGAYMWAVIQKEKNSVQLYHDTNNDYIWNAGDALIKSYPLVKQ